MAGNTTGKMFAVTTFGSSHGRALGAVVDGCPAGLELTEKDIQVELDKRKPGTSQLTTSRGETDLVEILSGVFEGKTDGTPITAIVYNKNADSSAYDNLKNKPRPGHGDYCWISRHGIYDYRGGGRGSGRTTIGHVIGGAIAKKLLNLMEIKVVAHVTKKAAAQMESLILEAKKEGNSVGGVVETIVLGAPAGLGEPVFGKLDADLAQALMGIGSVKGVEIGFGFKVPEYTAKEINDEYYLDSEKDSEKVKTTTNTSGGILGGMSNGMPIIMRMAVKPTPSISSPQKTVDLEAMEDVEIEIKGRHDPCICPRVVPVAEASVAMVMVDHLIRSGFINPCQI